MRTKNIHPKKVKIITLGCSKNIVDSEVIKSQLEANQFEVEHETSHKTPVVVINTCGFIDLAKEESINTILEYAEEKKSGRLEKLYVTGCLSQRYKDDLEVEIPEVDAYFGTMELPSLLATMGATYKDELIGERSIVTPPHYAYLKISEGCNRTCSFCAIPIMRGGHVSRTMESLVHEATHLAQRGVKELMLIAQELTYYGLDLYQRRALPELLDKLCAIEGIEWIRLHYAYPHKFPLEIIEVMKRQPKICNYLDMPLQHISDPVLKRMRRQITANETRDLIHNIRTILPGIRIRTTFLVGFPGETEAEFGQLLEFLEEAQLDRVGCFAYSPVEGAAANALPDPVPEEVKEERRARFMATQEKISAERLARKIGKRMIVLTDDISKNKAVARSTADAPEIDGLVYIDKAKNVKPGEFIEVEITRSDAHDLHARQVSDNWT